MGDIDNTAEIIAALEELTKTSVRVGIFGKTGSEIVNRAFIHEYGAPRRNIPERSFLRSSFDNNENKYTEQLTDYINRAIDGEIKPSTAYMMIGQTAAQDTQKNIKSVIPPPLKPSTIKRKGSSLPLVDTGQMINAITYEVEK